MTLRRRTPLKPSAGTRIPPDVRRYVEQRDRQCVGLVVGMPGRCLGGMEVDHVRASGALGRKSPSTADNLVRLCAFHHHTKTLDGRLWRPVFLAYIEGRS
jgi:hypothetical protein